MKQYNQGFTLIEGLLIVAVAAVVGFVGYRVYDANKHPQTPVSANQSTTASAGQSTTPAEHSATDVIAAVKLKLAADFKSEKKGTSSIEVPGAKGTVFIVDDENSFAYYKPSGANFYTLADKGKGVTIKVANSEADGSPATDLYKAITTTTNVFVSQGLKKIEDKAYTNELITTYTNGSTVCQVNSISKEQGTSNPAVANCSSIADIAETAKTLKPFADAYIAANPKEASTLLMVAGRPLTMSSKTPGYSTASVQIGGVGQVGGSGGKFYKKDGGQWQFFTALQQEADCSAYEANADLKAAFKGTDCYVQATGQQGAVQ